MTTAQSFLNTCVKVPIDPCNNCPAPVYNRPKLYMGKQVKATSSARTATTLDTNNQTWSSNTGIRSLAKFYDSIPVPLADYCEVKHLHEAEFYSTLESLRTTSRELRTQNTPPERCTSANLSNNSLASYCGIKTKTKKRQGNVKTKKQKSTPFLAPSITPILPAEPVAAVPTPPSPTCTKLPVSTHCMPSMASSPCLNEEYNKCLRDLSRLNSFKHDFALEVADFKRTLKGFEEEFKHTESQLKRQPAKCTSSSSSSTQTNMPERAKCRRELLRRSFSVNDLSAMPETPIATLPITLPKPTEQRQSSYFPSKQLAVSEVPKIIIESPTASSKRSSSATSSRIRVRRGRAKIKTKEETARAKPPFHLFELHSPKRSQSHVPSSASPVHPVSRPNLAATLRVEVSRKKVKELQNNCTYHDVTPQFDWEVRKTPAWKSLSLNESHKELLHIRLATRKAEQALQERQYELHMEMMRQRVKTAPLLLEGPTFWGPEVGKLTHTCRSEGIRHACDSNQQRSKQRSGKKKCGGTSSRCQTAVSAGCSMGADAHASSKLHQLRKIYSSSSAKSCSRQSQRSAKHSSQQDTEAHDSGDDLCSVDRAFL